MTEKLPSEISENENLRTVLTQAEDFLKENSASEASSLPSNLESEQQNAPNTLASDIGSSKLHEHNIEENNEAAAVDSSHDRENGLQESNGSFLSNSNTTIPPQSSENDSKSMESSRPRREGEMQVIEQFEPGVYVTLIVKPGDIKVFKRVRFRYYSYLFIDKFYIFNFYVSLIFIYVYYSYYNTQLQVRMCISNYAHDCVIKIVATLF